MNQNIGDAETVKLVAVGDGSVGKTCILLSYTTDVFPTDYVPTVFDNYTAQVQVNEKMINLNLVDTAGQETYDKIRTLSYGLADIFLIVFSVTEQSSFENALNKWYPELNKEELQKVPKLILGNKIDMRNDNNPAHMRKEAAEQILSQQGIQYLECSALTQQGLKDAFNQAIRMVISKRQEGQKDKEGKKQQDEDERRKVEKNKSCCCTQF